MFRYRLLLSIKESLQDYDYIYFFNANCLFVDYVEEEFLPTSDETVVAHFNYLLVKKTIINHFMYDRNVKSQAFISYNSGKIYAQ